MIRYVTHQSTRLRGLGTRFLSYEILHFWWNASAHDSCYNILGTAETVVAFICVSKSHVAAALVTLLHFFVGTRAENIPLSMVREACTATVGLTKEIHTCQAPLKTFLRVLEAKQSSVF